MKKIISLVLAVALVLALCTIGSFAADTNVALNKPVETSDTGGANDDFRMPEWFQKENLTDGINIPFDGNTNNLNQSLAWYTAGVSRDVDITAIVDLQGTYTVSTIKLFPTQFLNGNATPSVFTVEVSTDKTNWTVVASVSLADGWASIDPFVYSNVGKDANYVKINITKESVTADASNYFGGFAELEVYGSAPVSGSVRDFSKDAGDKLSFDQILVNGTEIANGNSAIIAAKKNIDGTKGDINTVTLHGWYGNANQDIDKFGYQINGGTIIYGEYKAATEPQVLDPTQGGGPKASRFTMDIDVSNLRGENTIWVYVKLANGDEVKLNRFENRGTADEKDREIYVVYNGPAAAPNTADASMIIFIVAAAAIALVVLKKKVF